MYKIFSFYTIRFVDLDILWYLKIIYLFKYKTFIYFLGAYTHVDKTIVTTPTKSRHCRQNFTDETLEG